MDIKKGCDLPEVRENTNSSKDPRSHFCALTVQHTCQGCIWLQCQLRDRMFMVCTSESTLCSLLASALHSDRSTQTTGICPRPRDHLVIFLVIACFYFLVFHLFPRWVPPFFKSIFMFLLSHTHGTAFFKPPAISLHSPPGQPRIRLYTERKGFYSGLQTCVSASELLEHSRCLLLGQELVKQTRRS